MTDERSWRFRDVDFGEAGGVSGEAGAVSLNVDASGNIVLPQGAALAQYLPPNISVLGAGAASVLGGVMGTIQGATPALSLIGTIASGQAPDPQQVVLAMSATVALVNPAAGALMGAIGEGIIGLQDGLDSLFTSMGLISAPPVTFGYHGGIRVGDRVPYGMADPAWQKWSTFAAPYLWNSSGQSAGTPYEYLWEHILSNENAASSTTNSYMQALLHACNRYGEVPGDVATHAGYQIGPIGKNPFEVFFYALLKQDIENWWNVGPAIPPRDLLMAAAALWNHTHGSAPATFHTQALTTILGTSIPVQVQIGGDVTYSNRNATAGGANDPIAWLLSQYGDITGGDREAADVTIFMGQPAKRVIALHLVAPSMAALSAPKAAGASGSKLGTVLAVGAVGLGALALIQPARARQWLRRLGLGGR